MSQKLSARLVGWQWLPVLVASLTGLVALLLFYALISYERQHLRQLLGQEAKSISEQLDVQVHSRVNSLIRMARRLDFWSERMGEDMAGLVQQNWAQDARLYVAHHKGYRGIAWVDATMKIQAIEPAISLEELFSEPLAENASARRAFNAAQADGQAKISPPFRLRDGEAGFVICVPVFRESEFLGCVTGITDLQELIDGALRDKLARGYRVSIAHGDLGLGPELYQGGESLPVSAYWEPAQSYVSFGDVRLAIGVWPTERLEAAEGSILPEATLLTGILTALLLAIAVRQFQQATWRAALIQLGDETLREAERRHRLTLENCLDAFVAIDEQGLVREWNQQAEKIFGWTRSEVLEQPLRDLILPEEYRDAHQHGLERFQQTGEGPLLNQRIEVDAMRKDGSRFPIELTITPIEVTAGWLFTAFIRDITARRQAEAELKSLNETLEQRVAARSREAESRAAKLREALTELTQAKEAAEAASRAKSAFLANMSHEIRTPLNAVIGMTELVLDTSLGPQQREYLTMVRDSGESLLSVINDILDFSKIEAGRLDLENLTFDHAETIGDAMKSMGFRAHSKGLELLCRIEPDVPQILVGDPGRLRQILVNLVGNAVKFTERGEIVVNVRRVSDATVADGPARGPADRRVILEYSVRDTGIGVPPDKLDKMFEAFEQADSSTTRRFGGTGLGLAISARLVEMMGGNIWAESDVGKGSTFHFRVEFEIPAEQPPRPVDASSIQNLRVLVVDDNATNRKILEEMLTRWSASPVCVAGGPAAIEALRQAREEGKPFRLVISDAHMPRMDGFELARRIKQDPKLSQGTVVLMLSSGDRPGDRGRTSELDIAVFLTKPIKQSELFEAVLLALGVTTTDEPVEEARDADDERRLRPLSILLAEDSPVNQKLALALLAKHGHQAQVANNGREAVDLCTSTPFDLVLMDVQMPVMDGLEATRVIRARESQLGHHTPIIAMTAYAMKGDRERCLEAGMDDYVPKPIRPRQLFATVARLLGEPTAEDRDESPTEFMNALTNGEEPPASGVIDWGTFFEAVHQDLELQREVAEIFLRESSQRMADLRAAVEQHDAPSVRREAHTLKGQFHIFGAAVAEHLALHLENTARDGRTDVTQALGKLEEQVALIRQEMQDFLAAR